MELIVQLVVLLACSTTLYYLPDTIFLIFPNLWHCHPYFTTVVPQTLNIMYVLASLLFFLHWIDVWRFNPVRAREGTDHIISDDIFPSAILNIWFTTVAILIWKSLYSFQFSLSARIGAIWGFIITQPWPYVTSLRWDTVDGEVVCFIKILDPIWFGSNILFSSVAGTSRWLTDFMFTVCFVDWISFWLVMLVLLTICICVLTSTEGGHKLHLYMITLCWISFFMILAFTTTNILVFYCSFEAVLIPTFFLIGVFGSSPTRVPASYRLVLFTTVGSILILLSMVIVYSAVGSLNFWDLRVFLLENPQLQLIILPLLFLGFGFKIPFFPVYLWLTSAHVEAPTSGSMILASLMLKLGVYGLLRFCFQLCPEALFYWNPMFIIFPLVGFMYIAYVTYAINDFKRLIAYTSVSHMNFLILAMISTSSLGFSAAVYTMISHAVISSALFFLIGSLYKRNGNRSLVVLPGLADTTPRLFFFLSLFLFANAGLPLFAGFPGELFALIALWQYSPSVFLVILPGFYFLVFGMVRALSSGCGTSPTTSLPAFRKILPLDLTPVEFAGIFILFVWQFAMALAPYIFLNSVFY